MNAVIIQLLAGLRDPEIADLVVRELREGEEAARRAIVETATQELRSVYRPREKSVPCGGEPSGVLVALMGISVVGTAEYIRKDHNIYVQGIAVHPDYRARGVCRALLRAAEKTGKLDELRALTLCAIEETGNVEIFKHLGFKVISRAIAPNHVSPSEDPVTQVDMERKIA